MMVRKFNQFHKALGTPTEIRSSLKGAEFVYIIEKLNSIY